MNVSNKRLLGTLPVLLLLAACGGGGGGGGANDGGGGGGGTAPQTSPTVALSYGVKRVKLTWDAVADATYYRVLKNRDGASGYSQIGADLTATAYEDEVPVHLTDWVDASYQVEACNSVGCTASASVTAPESVNAIGYVKAHNTGPLDEFGTVVAVSADGNTVAVGAPEEKGCGTGVGPADTGNCAGAGAVYVYFKHPAVGWTQQGYIKAFNTKAGDQFGISLSLSDDGNVLAVGAPGEDSGSTGVKPVASTPTDTGAMASGAVYLYRRTNEAWTAEAYIKASNTQTSDSFGWPVALSGDGNTLAVGARYEDGLTNSVSNGGAVYTFTYNAGAWIPETVLRAYNAADSNEYGRMLALSTDGNTLAVGDKTNHVYTYVRNVLWYGQSGQNYLSSSYFGCATVDSLAMSGSGEVLAFGATGGSGGVCLLKHSGTTWDPYGQVTASNVQDGDRFGTVALSRDGNTLAVGAEGESSNATGMNGNQGNNYFANAGAVYLFTRGESAWTQQSYVKPINPSYDNYFGGALALSDDGSTLVVGARGESGPATGIGGAPADEGATASGAAYVY